MVCFQMLPVFKGAYKQEVEWCFTWADSDSKRVNGFRLKEGKFGLGTMGKSSPRRW